MLDPLSLVRGQTYARWGSPGVGARRSIAQGTLGARTSRPTFRLGGKTMRARILFAVFLVPAAAYSGVSATIAEKQRTSTLFVEGSRLRMEDGKRILIFDGDAKRLVTIDPAKHTYGVSTEADMKALGAKYRPQMEAAEAEMRKRM